MKHCGELLEDNGMIVKCMQKCGMEHSHQDFPLSEYVKKGYGKQLKVTPKVLVALMQQWLDFGFPDINLGELKGLIKKAVKS